MTSGTSRLGRAAGAASLSTFSALALHVLAGGHTPSALAVAAPLLAAFAIAFQLAGRPLGRWRLGLAVAASQVALHTTFSLGSAHGPHLTGHVGHDPAAISAALDAAPLHAHAGAMPFAHVIAGAVTYAGIRRASSLVTALHALAALLVRVLLAGLRIAAAPVLAPAPRIVPAPRAPRAVASALLASLPSRAPPAAA
ncbi:hypothetical protein [Demequina soli]|uniref:hypothetical protein n=1 Tax=Demequina soli TaxID=1638987 RepID=UPI000782BDDD|nr:hypothetical protein [Demequina soli]